MKNDNVEKPLDLAAQVREKLTSEILSRDFSALSIPELLDLWDAVAEHDRAALGMEAPNFQRGAK